MNFIMMTDAGLNKLLDAVRDALADDDAQPNPQAKAYRVRSTPDWRAWSDAIEAELNSRGVAFTPVPR